MAANAAIVQIARQAAVRRCVDDLWQRLAGHAAAEPADAVLAVGS